MQQIQALRFDVEEVGKHVKGSKKRFVWDIALKDRPHTIGLDFSFISGKVKITVDRKILLENELPSNVSFQYPFTLDGFALNIIQQGQTFELRINNKVFSHLYTQQKTNTEFKKYEDDVKDIKVSINTQNNTKQKISLNIGAFGGMKKKKEKAGESASWDAFSGGSFPNYFGDQPQSAQVKPIQPPTVKAGSLLDEEEEKKQETSPPKVQKVEKDLLGEEPEPQKQENFFDVGLITSEAPKPSSGVEEFNTMQQMFSSMNVNQPVSKEIDFFSSNEPAKEPTPVTSSISSGFDLNFSANPQNFTTGVSYEHSNISAKSFATSAPGSKPAQVDYFNMAAQEGNAFSKKENPSTIKSTNPINQSNLTDISLNDFMNEKKSTQPEFQLPETFGQSSGFNVQPNSNDFNTMQMLFQTNSGGKGQISQISMTSANSPSPNDFFIANNSSINLGQQPSQAPQPKTAASNLDLFKENKPETFATMSGGASGGFDFNMASFGTMQASTAKGGQADFNFGKKPSGNNQGAGNLL